MKTSQKSIHLLGFHKEAIVLHQVARIENDA